MELLKLVRKRRSLLSELTYAALNIALAVAIFLIVRYTEAVWFALTLVVLSKWRVFAVRPRFWWANLRSNMVDFIVSVSVVMHLYSMNANTGLSETSKLVVTGGLTLLYIGWLLYIKPRSRRTYVGMQAGIATFLGISALFVVSYDWPLTFVVLSAWLIAYSAARHILGTYDDETHALFLALAWGLVVAEITWVSYHWAIAYPLPIINSLMLPQAALSITLLSFLAYKSYDSFYHHSKIRMNDVLLPLLFTLSVLLVLVVVFNRVGTAI